MLHRLTFSDDGLRSFCPVCGELKIVGVEIIHPALDKLYAEMLENGCTTTYISKKHVPKMNIGAKKIKP